MGSLIQIYRLSDLESLPEPEWLISEILHRETLAAIVGNRGSFKTFFALDWGLSIATGLSWNGRKVHAGNVLHIVGEGGRGIKRRAHAWRQEHGVSMEDTQRWACTVKPVDLLEHTEWLLEAVEAAYDPARLELVIVDTLARNNSGDENSTKEMSRLISQADRIKDTFGATVLFAHHVNRGGTFRGNSALDGAFDTIVQLDRKKDSEQVKVSCDKQKDAEEFESFVMKRKHVDLDYGVKSMVLVLDSAASPFIEGILDIIDRAGPRGITNKEAEEQAEQESLCKHAAFNDAWRVLKEQELIELAEDSPPVRNARYVRNMATLDLDLAA